MVMIRAILIALLIVAVAACGEKPSKNESFDIFINEFISKKEFSLDRTAVPLSSYRYEYGVDENGQDDSAVIETKVSKDTLAQQPTLGTYITTNNLSYEVVSDSTDNIMQIVKVFKPGTDWLIDFHFENKDGNWILVSTHDYSL